MPGIVGVVRRPRQDSDKGQLDIMLKRMLHENHYSFGKYMNGELGVYAGWVCHQKSFCDCMPVWNEKGDVVLIFFGENFPDLDLFDELKERHDGFVETNASYLIHMYEDKGIDFIRELNGWFSGLLIDLRSSKIVLFNDRYGMQRIFYHESKDSFYFASEAKALLEVCPKLRELDMQGVGELLCCGCVLENRTLFKNIYLLPSASAWTFTGDHKPDKSAYFDPTTWEDQTVLEKGLFYDRLKETLVRIIPRYFRSDQPIGISLTGGLDTRMLLANAVLPEGKYPCYTFVGMYRDCYDATVARSVAAAIGQTHRTIPLDKDFLNNFGVHAEQVVYTTDGYLDVSGAAEIYVNKLARQIAPIRVTGNFGGETTRSIVHIKGTQPNSSIYEPDFYANTNDVPNTIDKYKGRRRLSFIFFNDAPWHNNIRFAVEQSQLTLRTPYLDNDLAALMYQAPQETVSTEEASLRLIADGNPNLGAIMTDRGIGGSTPLPFSILVRLYREFFFKAEYAYNYGMPQWLARFDHTFKSMHFEKFFLGRHKFYHFRLWYRDDLAGYVKAMLLDSRTLNRPYLNRKAVEKVVEGHTKGYRNFTTEITQLLTLELIQRLFIEQR